MSQDDDDPPGLARQPITTNPQFSLGTGENARGTSRTRANPSNYRLAVLLTLVIVLISRIPVSQADRLVNNVKVLGYTEPEHSALVELELRNPRDTELYSLEVAVGQHKCEPPFLAQTPVNLSQVSDALGLPQPLNLNFLLPALDLVPAEVNRTLRLCVRTNLGEWRNEKHIFFPAVTNDSLLVSDRLDDSLLASDQSTATQEDDDDEYNTEEFSQVGSKLKESLIGRHRLMESRPGWNEVDTKPNQGKWNKLKKAEADWRKMKTELKRKMIYDEDEAEADEWRRVGRVRRQEAEEEILNGSRAKILSVSLEETSSKTSYTDDGRITVLEGQEFNLILIGINLVNSTNIKFTTSRQSYGESCGYHDRRHSKTVPFQINPLEDGYATVSISGESLKYYSDENVYFVCVQDPDTGEYVHQGENKHLQIEVYSQLLPTWLSIIFLAILLCLSGLFSGLNLGLMSLDQTELRIVMNTGSETEKSYAKAIMPIRGMGNFLLCSILLGNVLVNNTLTVLLDTLTGGGGIVAVIGATLGIVIFGEIIPQAICSRHGLAVGAKTIWLTKFFMFVTSPLAFPISKILDKILGTEIGTVYNRERLMELIKVTDKYTDLEKDEVNIVTGALVLKRKTVKDVMTRLDDCYMLPLDTVLNFETISEIKEQGYSRIPVYEEEKSNVKHILFAKDLLFVDPDDNKPLEEVCKFYKNDVNFVFQDTILTDMFDEFKSGEKGHLAMVQEANTEGDGDPYYETIGLLTLEDIIEEIIQQEINDETDVILDNKTKKKRKKREIKDADFKMFLETRNKQRVHITPHLSLAILQFLTTSVKSFAGDVISARVLQKLLSMDVYREIKLKCKEKKRDEDDTEGVIMTKGKPCDYFILILEGRVQVTIGKEDHKFIEGPFTTFGEQMLEQAMMLPSSPIVSDPARGTTLSLSMHSSVNEVVPARALRKTNTQVHLESANGRRSGSADAGLPNIGRATHWVPDYTVKAITDLVYLKIRKATYLVALKASRMNNMNSELGGYNEKELDIALERVTEDDNDTEFGRTPSGRSPEKYWENHIPRSHTGTPTEMRRESLRSSLSMMKSKFLGSQFKRSSNSIDKSKDEFWDGMANPALDSQSEDIHEQGEFLDTPTGNSIPLGSSPGGLHMNPGGGGAALNLYNMVGGGRPTSPSGGGAGDVHVTENGPLSLPLKKRQGGGGGGMSLEKPSHSDATPLSEDGQHTTVITVRGSGGGGAEEAVEGDGGGGANNAANKAEGREAHNSGLDSSQLSPTDRTSLLGSNGTVS